MLCVFVLVYIVLQVIGTIFIFFAGLGHELKTKEGVLKVNRSSSHTGSIRRTITSQVVPGTIHPRKQTGVVLHFVDCTSCTGMCTTYNTVNEGGRMC